MGQYKCTQLQISGYESVSFPKLFLSCCDLKKSNQKWNITKFQRLPRKFKYWISTVEMVYKTQCRYFPSLCVVHASVSDSSFLRVCLGLLLPKQNSARRAGEGRSGGTGEGRERVLTVQQNRKAKQALHFLFSIHLLLRDLYFLHVWRWVHPALTSDVWKWDKVKLDAK